MSIAHAFPGTEFFDYAKDNGFITNEAMSDEGGHQMAHIEYPGLPVEYVMEMVHKFYDEYYFRPKAAMRVIWQAIVNRDVPRLYTEARSFMKLRAQRNKAQAQRAAGLRITHVMRNLEDPGEVVLLFDVEDVDRAKAFVFSPQVPGAQQESGVADRPDIYFLT